KTILEFDRIIDKNSLKIGFVIDQSSSMRSEVYYDLMFGHTRFHGETSPFDKAIGFTKEFLQDSYSEQDSFIVLTFSDSINYNSGFIGSQQDSLPILDTLTAHGGTILYDAISVMIDSMAIRDGYKMIICITDGYDGSSSINEDDLIKKINNSKTPIFLIGLGEYRPIEKVITNASGGKYYSLRTSSSIDEIKKILDQTIAYTYKITYLSDSLKIPETEIERKVRITSLVDSIFFLDHERKLSVQDIYTRTLLKKIVDVENELAINRNKLWVYLMFLFILSLGLIYMIFNKIQPFINKYKKHKVRKASPNLGKLVIFCRKVESLNETKNFLHDINQAYRGISEFLHDDYSSNINQTTDLQIKKILFNSPGIWEFFGKLNPLEIIREYLNDRHERNKDRDYRNRLEEEKGYLELKLLENKIVKERIDLLEKAGFTKEEIKEMLKELAVAPLLSLGKYQENKYVN
ncbi:MAG: VWA domain-containing protein, partial [Bacteroidetes bacterium]|nr:VWA domain-containing protein [Bacteroidota bacterium]